MSAPLQKSPAKDLAWLRAGPEAAALLACLRHEAFADAADDQWSENDFAQILVLPTTVALIALTSANEGKTNDGQKIPAGFVVFTEVLDESEILTLGVIPSYRKTGIGHSLVQAVLERSRENDIKCLFLEVREDNLAARQLYERHGFLPAGRRKAYYRLDNGQQVDAIIMRQNIA